jgi:redox-sensitive bicupin YhaK (pirin superfamily)
MSAGTGVTHSEFNTSKTEPVHFMQIWILPARRGLAPSYAQRSFPAEARRNALRLVVDPEGREDALTINADARLYTGLLDAGASVTHELAKGRHAWVQVARGRVELDGEALAAGDGAATSDAGPLTLTAVEDAEVLVFDLP